MANPMQIPGLFLPQASSISHGSQDGSSFNTKETQPASIAQNPLPPLPSFTSSDIDRLRAAVQYARTDAADKADLLDENGVFSSAAPDAVSQGPELSASDPSDRDREEGELTDASMDISSVAQSPVNERKRKAGSPIDDFRANKVVPLIGIDKLQSQRVQAQQIIATLLANGFPFEQLIQDISGIAQARRQQAHPPSLPVGRSNSISASAPQIQQLSQGYGLDGNLAQLPNISPSTNLTAGDPRVEVHHVPTVVEQFHDAIPLVKPQTKPIPAKTKPGDSQAYKSRLEALKKVSQASTAESAPEVKTTLPQSHGPNAPGNQKTASDTNPVPSPRSGRAQSQLDMGKLQMRIAALRAENASKQQAASFEPPKNVRLSGSATPDHESTQEKSPSRNPLAPHSATKGRLTAMDLIEGSDLSELPSGLDTTPFKSPMGIDKEVSMIIEASSSEDSDDEHASSEKLETLTSDIALLNARIAAKLREREQSSKSPAVHISTGARTEESSSEVQETISEEPILEAVDVVYVDDHTPSTKSKNEDCIVHKGSEPEECHEQSIPDPETESSAEAINTHGNGTDNEMSAQTTQIQSTELSAESSVEQITASSSASGGGSDDDNDNDNDDEDEDEDAPMSIDSGDYPTPEPLGEEVGLQEGALTEGITGEESEDGDESVPMDMSDSESEDYEPRPLLGLVDAGLGAATETQDQPASSTQSNSGSSEDDSEDEYDPELPLTLRTGAGLTVLDRGTKARSPSSSGSNSRSPSPEGGWRKFPQVQVSSGVTIRDESGMQLDKDNVTPKVEQTAPAARSFIPYEPRLRFSSDVLFDPLNSTS